MNDRERIAKQLEHMDYKKIIDYLKEKMHFGHNSGSPYVNDHNKENCLRLSDGKHYRFDSPETKATELESLCFLANLGERAKNRLYNEYYESQDLHLGGLRLPKIKDSSPIGFSLESVGRTAEITKEKVVIGCQEFNTKNLHRALDYLLKVKTACSHSVGSDIVDDQIQASRDGLMYDGHLITYIEADALLETIEKVMKS